MRAKKLVAGLVGAIALIAVAAPASATTGTSQEAAVENSKAVQSIVATGATITSVTAVTGGFQVLLTGGNTGPGGTSIFVPQSSGTSMNLFHAGQKGFSAQGSEGRLALWGQYGFTRFDEDQPAVDSDGTSHAFVFGGDYLINRWMRAGLAFSFDHTNTMTTFNRGNSRMDGYTLLPYALFQLIENRLFLDVAAGYAFTKQKSDRNNGAITSEADGNRYIVSSNLTALFAHKNWSIRPGAGIMWSRSKTDEFRESTGVLAAESVNHFGRMHVGTDLGYNFARWQPFVSAKYLYDYQFDYPTFTGVTQPTEHRSAGEFGLGASFAFTKRLSGTVKGTTEAFRKDNTKYGFTGSMRYAF